MKARIARTVTAARRAPDPKLAPKHIAFVKSLGCMLWDAYAGECGGDMDPHHLKRLTGEGPAGVSGKHGDRWAIGLCRHHHTFGPNAIHEHGNDEERLAELGFDGRAIAAFLWAHTGDEHACRAYLDKARDLARLKARGHGRSG